MRIKRLFALFGASALLVAGVPAAPAGASGSRNQHFIILSSDPSDTAIPVVVATGPIHALGTDTNSAKERFVFPHGSLKIRHQTKHSKDSYDPVTCYGVHTETGAYQITDGTRAYDDARGSGTFKVTVTFVGCSRTAPPNVFQLRIDAFGPLAIGD